MLKERIQEVVEFTKSESPYRKANQGWINKDIFLDLNPSADTSKRINEAAKVTLFWTPINSLLSNIFLIFILGSILVFTSVSFSKGRLNFNSFNNSSIIESVKDPEKKSLNIVKLEDIDSSKIKLKQQLETKDLSDINSLEDDLMSSENNTTNPKKYKQDNLNKKNQSNKDIENLQNKKPKSNFI